MTKQNLGEERAQIFPAGLWSEEVSELSEEYPTPTAEDYADANRYLQRELDRARKQASSTNEVVLEPGSVETLARKITELQQNPNASTLAEIRNLLAAREQKERLEAEARSEEEDRQMVQGAIKEAGSSLTGLTMLLEAIGKQEMAQTRAEADANPRTETPWPDPKRRSGIFQRDQRKR